MAFPRPLGDSLRARLNALVEWGRAHRFWLQCGATTLLLVLAALFVGLAALRSARRVEARAAELEAVRVRADRWAAELQPPAAAESLAWRQSVLELERLSAQSAEPLLVAAQVVGRGEELGIRGVRARLELTDSIAPPPAVSGGDWAIQSTTTGIAVTLPGEFHALASFVSALPPHVRLWSLRFARMEEGPTAQLLLLLQKVESTR